MDDTISTRDLARLLGVTAKTLSVWAGSGVVVRRTHGKYDLAESVERMWALVKAKGGEGPASAVATVRARLLRLQADRAQFEIDRLSGAYMLADDAVRQWGGHQELKRRDHANPGAVAERVPVANRRDRRR